MSNGFFGGIRLRHELSTEEFARLNQACPLHLLTERQPGKFHVFCVDRQPDSKSAHKIADSIAGTYARTMGEVVTGEQFVIKQDDGEFLTLHEALDLAKLSEIKPAPDPDLSKL